MFFNAEMVYVSLKTRIFLQLNALANRAAGKGYENEDNYSNIRFQFVGIENIHVMRASLQKLLEGKRAAMNIKTPLCFNMLTDYLSLPLPLSLS